MFGCWRRDKMSHSLWHSNCEFLRDLKAANLPLSIDLTASSAPVRGWRHVWTVPNPPEPSDMPKFHIEVIIESSTLVKGAVQAARGSMLGAGPGLRASPIRSPLCPHKAPRRARWAGQCRSSRKGLRPPDRSMYRRRCRFTMGSSAWKPSKGCQTVQSSWQQSFMAPRNLARPAFWWAAHKRRTCEQAADDNGRVHGECESGEHGSCLEDAVPLRVSNTTKTRKGVNVSIRKDCSAPSRARAYK